MRSTPVSYILWLFCFIGLCGLHRFYHGRWVTGLIWLFTFGLLGFGQLIDLFLIPGMTRISNLEQRVERMAWRPAHA
ncbi:MAG: NINE protein [Phycisphaeraceae bacterium]|nr:MAG: NINE protein [Phycisphaeraceae bacterium]